MSYTSLSLSNLASGETGYIVFDADTGLKVVKEATLDGITYFRDITSGTTSNLTSVASTVILNGTIIRDISSTGSADSTGNFSSLSTKVGKLLYLGSSWVRLTKFINNSLIEVSKIPSKPIPTTGFTVASPCVITTATPHGLSVDDPVALNKLGALPTGLSNRTRYYVGTVPSSTTLTLSTTTSNGNPVAVTALSGVDIHGLQRVFTLQIPAYLPDELADSIVAKVTNTSGTYTLEPYYSVAQSNDTPLTLVDSLPASGNYVGEAVLLTTTNTIYTWTGSAWDESAGLSVTTVNAYQRSATLPATPTGGSFNFSTNTLTPPSGWSASVPSGSDPIYVVSSGASVTGTSGTDTSLTWTTPVILAQDGADGAPGSAGTDAKAIKLTASQYAVLYDGTGTKTAVAITLTGTAINFTSPQYRFLENGVERQAWSTTSTYTIPDAQEPAANTADSWTVEVREGSSGTYEAFDTVSIYGVQDGTDGTNGTNGTDGTDGADGANGADGADAYTVILTNEAHTLPTTNTGTVTYTGSGTSIVVYKGTTELNSVTGTPTTGQFSVSASGSNITPGSITVTGNPAVVADHSSMTTDLASVTYTINIENTTTVTKIQSLSKSIEGADGATGATGAAGADGADGDPGLRTIQGYLYYEKTTAGAPSAPTGNTYTFSTGVVTGTGINDAGTTNVWKNSPNTQDPSSTNTHYTIRYYGTEAAASSSTIAVSYSSVVQFTDFSGVVTFSAGTFSQDGTDITTIDGGNIATDTIAANRLTLGNTTGTDRMKLYDDGIDIYSGGNLRVRIGNLSPTGRS